MGTFKPKHIKIALLLFQKGNIIYAFWQTPYLMDFLSMPQKREPAWHLKPMLREGFTTPDNVQKKTCFSIMLRDLM